MNATIFVSTTVLAFLVFAANAAEMQHGSSQQPAYYQYSIDLPEGWGKFTGSYSDNKPAPHWTDSLRKESLVPQQAMGVEYGRSYGAAGALRPATDDAFGPVAIYFRATF